MSNAPTNAPPVVRVKGEWPNNKRGHYPLVFVAEAPSDEEIIYGKPLIGPSGRLFNKLLRVAEIERSQCPILNTFEYELPSDEGAKYNALTEDKWEREHREVSAAEKAWPEYGKSRWLRPEHFPEIERLQSELALAQPNVIVTLGYPATWAVTREMGAIKSRRGTMTWAEGDGWCAKVMPTYHPAAIIREWGMFNTVAGDLVKALRESKSRELVFTPRELWLRPTLQDLHDWKRRFVDGAEGPLSVDIETSCGQITCIGFSIDRTHAICVPFVDFESVNRSYWKTQAEEELALGWVKMMLDLPIRKLFQNGPYDVYWIRKKWSVWPRNYSEDTRLMHHALFPELPKSLAFMGSVYANVNAWKRMREKDSEKRDE